MPELWPGCPPSEASWVWHGNELVGPVGRLAQVRSDVVYVADERALVEYERGRRFRMRATATSGDVFTVVQRGLTVSRLAACCQGRDYDVDRVSVWRKERRVFSHGKEVGQILPRISGKVEILGPIVAGEVPLIDAVVISWACVLVDASSRFPRT
ncbi:hypothetical protein CATYP_07775 [Corynebacterium atypicum]|uniref:Uncharacterized protein n=1 Tax=Corynebacterium atypicum TaxID=191610 RepID=A0ABN4DDH0_9CORY|nr:hypothetical protein [Corynebacterium atypicum]AIG64500.1 hypothetical protein CATYP_07775 [Corynebacterium atypicum]